MATRLKKGSKAARDYMAKIRGMKKSAPKKKAAPKKKPRAVGKATGQPSLFDRINNDYQTGTSNKEYDRKRVALPPGIRKSKETCNEYTERRANRSDKKGSLLGTNVNTYVMMALKDSLERLAAAEKNLSNVKNTLDSKTFSYNKVYTAQLKKDSVRYSELIKDIKKHLTQLKKRIK